MTRVLVFLKSYLVEMMVRVQARVLRQRVRLVGLRGLKVRCGEGLSIERPSCECIGVDGGVEAVVL